MLFQEDEDQDDEDSSDSDDDDLDTDPLIEELANNNEAENEDRTDSPRDEEVLPESITWPVSSIFNFSVNISKDCLRQVFNVM